MLVGCHCIVIFNFDPLRKVVGRLPYMPQWQLCHCTHAQTHTHMHTHIDPADQHSVLYISIECLQLYKLHCCCDRLLCECTVSVIANKCSCANCRISQCLELLPCVGIKINLDVMRRKYRPALWLCIHNFFWHIVINGRWIEQESFKGTFCTIMSLM